MKKLIFLLFPLLTLAQNPTNFPYGIKNPAATSDSAPAYFTTSQVDGVHKKTPAANVEKTANKSDSYTTSSSTTYASTKALVDGLGTKQEIIFVTPDQFGAVGDGVTDDSTAFQNFLNSTLPKKILADKIYKIETELIINNPNNLDFNNSTLTSATLLRLLTIKSSDVYISNGNFISNMTGDYTVITEIEPYANSWLIGCKLVTGEFFENINIINSHFSTPSGSLNAVKLISHRSGFGGELKHINIKNNRFEEIGRMAVEVLGEGLTQWYSHVNISNNYFNDLGIWSDYGMAISLSGLGTENFISENIIEQAKDICIENAGANNTYILNNTSKNPKTGVTPMAINSGDSGVRGFGNLSLNNTFEGTYGRGIQVIYQNNYFSQGNRVDKAENLALINEVSNSKFIADYFNSTLAASVVLQNTSSNNTFDNCIFSVFESLAFTDNIACQTSSSNNYFSNSKFINSTFGGVSLTQSGGATNNLIEKYIVKDNITTLSGYGITDAVTIGTTQTITGAKTSSLKWNFLDSWANSQISLGAVGQGGLMRFVGTGGTGTLGYLGATSSALQLYSPNVLTLNSANYIDFQFNGTQKMKVFGSTGNIVIQNGGTFTDNVTDRLQVNGSILATSYTGGATLTGTPTAPTATAGTNTTQIATTAFVQNAMTSGTYVPTFTNTTNISSSTLNAAYYTKINNIITVTIAVQLTLTATADTVFTFSLPVSGATVVNGVGQGNLTSGGGSVNAYGIVDTTNSTTAQLRIGSAAVAGSGAGVANIIFTYSL